MKKIIVLILCLSILSGCDTLPSELNAKDIYEKVGDVYTLTKDLKENGAEDELAQFTTFIQCIGDYDVEDVKKMIVEHPEVYEEFINSDSITAFEGFIPRNEDDSIDVETIIEKSKSFFDEVKEHKDEINDLIDKLQTFID